MAGKILRYTGIVHVIFGHLVRKPPKKIFEKNPFQSIVDECKAQECSLEDDIAELLFGIKSQNEEKKMNSFSKRAKGVLDKLTESEAKRVQDRFID